MRKEEFEKINSLDDSHWWYVGMRETAFSVIERFLDKTKKYEIIDIGCGTGRNMYELTKYGTVEGVDVDDNALRYCRAKGFVCSKGSMETLSENKKFDLLTLFEVFYQVKPQDQQAVIRRFKAGLAQDGILIMREPAFEFARGRHDLEVNTQMRFTVRYLTEMLQNNGFKVVYASYLNTLLFLPILVTRKVQLLFSKQPRSDVEKYPRFLNAILLGIMRFEKFLLRYIKLPFGISILVIAKNESPRIFFYSQ